jgi:hypothetical protein
MYIILAFTMTGHLCRGSTISTATGTVWKNHTVTGFIACGNITSLALQVHSVRAVRRSGKLFYPNMACLEVMLPFDNPLRRFYDLNGARGDDIIIMDNFFLRRIPIYRCWGAMKV